MNYPQSLRVTTRGDREIVITRVFDAPRQLVFDAFSKPELLQRWLTGPPGWSMTVCEVASRVGDKYRYVWRSPDGTEMGMVGVLREIVPPERMVATEKFERPWYPGEAVGTIVLVDQAGKTILTQTIVYESREIRDMVLKSPMEQGMEMGYKRLEEFLAELAGSREGRP